MVSEAILEGWVDFNWQIREKERHREKTGTFLPSLLCDTFTNVFESSRI